MIGWLYLIIGLLLWHPFAVAAVEAERRRWPTLPIKSDDYMWGAVFGFLKAAFWPATLLVYGATNALRKSVEGPE